MASKKFLSFIVLICLVTSSLSAQVSGSYDVMDSSVIPSKRLPQHSEFMAHTYPFPALPRNQWEIGIKAGTFTVAGDVRSRIPGFGAALHVRKALGYVFSLRGELGMGIARGLNFSPSVGYKGNPAWNTAYDFNTTPVYYNYKTNIYQGSIQAVASLNNIRFHKAKSTVNVYAFGGLGGLIYDTKIDALNGTAPYDFSGITPGTYETRKDTKKALKDLLDGDYETKGEDDILEPHLFDKPFRPVFEFGAGISFKLNQKLSLAIEDKVSISKSDLIDGQQWQEGWPAGPSQTRDTDPHNFFSVGLNFAIGKKSVEPLWWINPLDYAYNEINKPRHMLLPKPILDDKDSDGITDQFDNEPNTPAGAPVDSHGVSRDTDGDGVPDYKDKELVTPTQWQPVDADGVGKAPEPDCCKELREKMANMVVAPKCNIGSLPSITFKGKSVALSNDAKALLASVAQTIKNNPDCKVAVVGYCASSKADQQLSWDRVNAIINYLVDKESISADRFVFKYGQEGGDCNTVDLQDGTGDEGPTTVPAPHPNLRRKG